MNPRRDSKGLEKTRKGSVKGHEERHQGEKELSTKGHEERRRATKGLEKAQEGSAKGREGEKDFHEGRYSIC